MSKHLKVSESVCAGHPDKLADQISDAILDAALEQDPWARVAAETLVANNTIILAGELNTSAKIDFEKIAREVIKENGYTVDDWGFSYNSPIINRLHQQSPDIAVGVDNDGAGDQGLMYGYATDETKELMPLPVVLAHEICQTIDDFRNNGTLTYLRPDGKSQVVVEYDGEHAVGIKHITVAVPHDEDVDLATVRQDIVNKVLQKVVSNYGFNLPDEIVVNGTGVWHLPGPSADVGLTGRKIVVDTYGGAAKVGGGAFSGKDPSKVDRSGAYAARYIAKNIVAKGLAKRAEICLAYYIGAKKPIIQTIETFGTRKVEQNVLEEYANQLLNTSVKGINEGLNLRRPIYAATSVYGHFGKTGLPWEAIDKSVKI
jgi:S-adenosylmethionine synthetase